MIVDRLYTRHTRHQKIPVLYFTTPNADKNNIGLMRRLFHAVMTTLNPFSNRPNQPTNRPKAYLNWVLFDDNLKPVYSSTQPSSNSEFEQVGPNGEVTTHNRSTEEITKNGYLYVYCSNESMLDVFFDNLQVIHTRSALLEETHYYPFGLIMAGISSKAAAFGDPENKRKWNAGNELESKEFSDGSGLELYSTFYRSLDPQLGRFWQIDPKPDFSQSLYGSMGNNPIRFNDPLGDTVALPGLPKSLLKYSTTLRVIY